MKNWILTGLFFLIVSNTFSQVKIKGTITNGEKPIHRAVIKDLRNNEIALTNRKGNFFIYVKQNIGKLEITAKGYESEKIEFDVVYPDLKTIKLSALPTKKADSIPYQNRIVHLKNAQAGKPEDKNLTIDIAKDRKAPVATTNIKDFEIKEILGNQEFTKILAKATSAYTPQSGIGFGDSQITIRGFDQRNIGVMINGVPINNLEDGFLHWNNWMGLSDITSSIQVQRGMGSSKLTIPYIAGTINLMTQNSDIKKGGMVLVDFGNNNYSKRLASYSTGKMKSGFSTSILLSQIIGDGFVDGTKFSNVNYMINFGYQKEKHDIKFALNGSPQWHNQRINAPTIEQYKKYSSDENPNIRYNTDWGNSTNGEYSFGTNYYNKPIMSLNWNYDIDIKNKLSTLVYGSWGRGGETNGAGGIRGNAFNSDALRKADGTIDIDLIRRWNSGAGSALINGTNYTRNLTNTSYQNSVNTGKSSGGVLDNLSGISKISSLSLEDLYGGIVNLNNKLSNHFTLDLGIDVKMYKGTRYQNIIDMLGATNYKDNTDINNPNRLLTTVYDGQNMNPFFSVNNNTQKINYNNDISTNWYGVFSQLEYNHKRWSAFVQGAVSNQSFKRNEYFTSTSSKTLDNIGVTAKGGINYNLSKNSNIFANCGYYDKQPFPNVVYPANLYPANEKALNLEAGYGFRSDVINANFNVYHTTSKNRNQRNTDYNIYNPGGYFTMEGISETHSGIELDIDSKVNDRLKINGMLSVGNWVYNGNVTSNRFNLYNQLLTATPTTLYLDGVKVGNTAQTTANFGAVYGITDNLNINANYRAVDRLYSSIAPVNSNGTTSFYSPVGASLATNTPINRGTIQLPSYGLIDLGLSYRFLPKKKRLESINFRLNINNALDKIYIADSKTSIASNMSRSEFPSGSAGDVAYTTYVNQGSYNGVHASNQVFFGFGRTWNFSISYNF